MVCNATGRGDVNCIRYRIDMQFVSKSICGEGRGCAQWNGLALELGFRIGRTNKRRINCGDAKDFLQAFIQFAGINPGGNFRYIITGSRVGLQWGRNLLRRASASENCDENRCYREQRYACELPADLCLKIQLTLLQ